MKLLSRTATNAQTATAKSTLKSPGLATAKKERDYGGEMRKSGMF